MNKLIIDNTIEPKRAAQKSATIKPDTKLDTSQNKNPLTINVNKPKVSKLIGRVKSSKIGLINILTKPITKAAQIADMKPSKLMPGTIQATKSKERANSSHLTSISNMLFPPIKEQFQYTTS